MLSDRLAEDVERGGCGVLGNGLDRERMDVFVDHIDKMHACDVLAFQVLVLVLKAISRRNTSLVVSSNTVAVKCRPAKGDNCEMGQQAVRPAYQIPKTIQ